MVEVDSHPLRIVFACSSNDKTDDTPISWSLMIVTAKSRRLAFFSKKSYPLAISSCLICSIHDSKISDGDIRLAFSNADVLAKDCLDYVTNLKVNILEMTKIASYYCSFISSLLNKIIIDIDIRKSIYHNHFHNWYIPIRDVIVPHAPTTFAETFPYFKNE